MQMTLGKVFDGTRAWSHGLSVLASRICKI